MIRYRVYIFFHSSVLCVKIVFHLATDVGWKSFCQMLILLLLGNFLVLIIQYYCDCPISCFIRLFLFGKVLQKQNAWWTNSWHPWAICGLYCAMQVNMKSTNTYYTVQAFELCALNGECSFVYLGASLVLNTAVDSSSCCRCALGWLGAPGSWNQVLCFLC